MNDKLGIELKEVVSTALERPWKIWGEPWKDN
jgi:hypothetical protein